MGEPGVDGRIILSWIFRKWDGECGRDQAGSGKGQVADICDCGNEPSGSIKCGEFLDYLKPVRFSRWTLLHKVIKYGVSIIFMIYLLTAIGTTPGGSSTIHIHTQTIHRTTELIKYKLRFIVSVVNIT